MTQVPPPTPSPGGPMRAHRGAMILVFGILGIVICFIFGIVAWVMGNGDLREMAAGRMDPSGEGLTRAGKICGIIGVVLAIIGIALWLLMVVLGLGLAAAGAGT
jgi:flagellar biogenesis protein FliO